MSDAAYRIWNEVWPGVPQEKMREALTRLSPGDRVGPNGEYVVVPVEPSLDQMHRALHDIGTPSPKESKAWLRLFYRAMLAALKEQDK